MTLPQRTPCIAATWQFDDLVVPPKIVGCPTLCDILDANTDARLDARVGCERPVIR